MGIQLKEVRLQELKLFIAEVGVENATSNQRIFRIPHKTKKPLTPAVPCSRNAIVKQKFRSNQIHRYPCTCEKYPDPVTRNKNLSTKILNRGSREILLLHAC